MSKVSGALTPVLTPVLNPILSPVLGGKTRRPSWLLPDAIWAANFELGQYWRKGGGLLPAASLLTTTRSSVINLPDSAGVFQTLGNNTLPRTDRGLYANGQFVQSAANWNAPANETISLGTGTFTLAVWGSGSIAVAAGTATGSGFGSASEGSPVTFALSGAGTVSITVTGSPDYVSVTNTSFAPPASNPPGTVLASDIRAVQGTRPSNSNPEPFPGWEVEGLDEKYKMTVSVNIDRLNSSVARTIAAIGADAQHKMHVYLDTDNRIKAQLLKLGPELNTGVVNTISGSWTQSGGIITAPGSNGADSVSFNLAATFPTQRRFLVLCPNTMPLLGFFLDFGPGTSASQIGGLSSSTTSVIMTSQTDVSVIRAGRWAGTPTGTIGPLSVREIVTHFTLQSDVITTPGAYDVSLIAKPGSYALAVTGAGGSTSTSAEPLPTGSTTLRIGSDFGTLTPFNGWVDELQIERAA